MVDHVKYKCDQLSIITFFKRFIFVPNNCGVKLVTFSHLASLLKKKTRKKTDDILDNVTNGN